MGDESVEITPDLSIPLAELSFRTSRSGGPGGQHVNTSSTRVELVWDVSRSPSLNEEQRELVLTKLANRINTEGVLAIASSATRSQHRNREDVLRRFATIVARTLALPRPRHRTRPPAGANEERLGEKRHRSRKKELRRPVDE